MKDIKPVISIQNLHKSYGKKEVLHGFSLDIYPGEIFSFIGRNGVGKSTTIECMIGIKPFDSGTIKIFDYSIKDDPLKAKAYIGYSSAEPMAYEEMTGISYIRFISSVYKANPNDAYQRMLDLSSRLELSLRDLNRPIREYSHGMQQKVCLIAAMVANPPILVLDEPTVGLDAFTTEQLVSLIKEHKEKGNTVVLASHNIELVSRIVDRVAIIHEGNLLRIFDFHKEENARKELPSYFLEHCKEKE